VYNGTFKVISENLIRFVLHDNAVEIHRAVRVFYN
jgi:hypothetical protein